MPGRPSWLLRHKLLVMFLLRKQLPMDDVIRIFKQEFPPPSNGNGSTKEPIGHSAKSIEYCRKTYLRNGAYNLERFWMDADPMAPQGKIGYLLGLHDRQHSPSDIAHHIQERFPALGWPEGYSKDEVVEIGVITYHEYAAYAGHLSLINKYPVVTAPVPRWVITGYNNCLQNSWTFDCIPGLMPMFDYDGSLMPRMTFDEVVFILTRFISLRTATYNL